MNPKVEINKETVALNNREVMRPFIDNLVIRLNEELDKAAEKGVALKTGISDQTAEKILTQVLYQLQKDYQGDIYESRNIFESIVYVLGMSVGYPTEAVMSIMRKLPFSAHFSAGWKSGEIKFNCHALALYSKFNTKNEEFKAFKSSIVKKFEKAPESAQVMEPNLSLA